MTFDTIAVISLVLAGIPCGLFLLNLFVYRRLSSKDQSVDDGVGISVLIPARNEEQNIRATLEAVLANHGCKFDVIVLDDHSTDHTANMVGEFSRRDKRVRLESAPRLPVGWCGKQHACHVLAKLARYPLLIFIDADVRLAPDALVRISALMNRSGVALASGVPLQELGSLSERLLIPQIHFILLGFLPMHLMRRTRIPGFSAGCGQLFVARRDAYEATGGHAMVRDSLHDGLKLPRLFRRAGFRTDLFDATDIATCRMYRTNAETWRGLGRNATEGLAAPTAILPMTILLLGGQVVPFICLLFGGFLTRQGIVISIIASVLALIPRIISSLQFRQPLGTTLLHPIGVMALLWIQWYALFRYLAGKPSTWKGRSYGPPTVAEPAKNDMKHQTSICLMVSLLLAEFASLAQVLSPFATNAPPVINLTDQYNKPQQLHFPWTNLVLLTIADKKGSEQIDAWIAGVKPGYSGRIEIRGLADLAGAPAFIQDHIRRKFQQKVAYPVMLDWSGDICAAFGYERGVANILLIEGNGRIQHRFSGIASKDKLQQIRRALEKMISPPSLSVTNKAIDPATSP